MKHTSDIHWQFFWLSSRLCSMGIFLINFAGTPAHSVPGSIMVLLNTKAPAATIAPSPTTA